MEITAEDTIDTAKAAKATTETTIDTTTDITEPCSKYYGRLVNRLGV